VPDALALVYACLPSNLRKDRCSLLHSFRAIHLLPKLRAKVDVATKPPRLRQAARRPGCACTCCTSAPVPTPAACIYSCACLCARACLGACVPVCLCACLRQHPDLRLLGCWCSCADTCTRPCAYACAERVHNMLDVCQPARMFLVRYVPATAFLSSTTMCAHMLAVLLGSRACSLYSPSIYLLPSRWARGAACPANTTMVNSLHCLPAHNIGAPPPWAPGPSLDALPGARLG